MSPSSARRAGPRGGTFKKGVLVESPADQAADESGQDQQVA